MENVILHDKVFVPFISSTEIAEILQELALKINEDFKDKNPLFLSVLNGSFMFTSDLMKLIKIPCELSFVKLASYHGMNSSGQIQELIGLNQNMSGKNIIILEDIVDTGNTLGYLLDVIKTHDFQSISVCTLLLKPEVFNKKYPIHYVGKNIPNKFVVGYGLDYDGLGRNIPEIYQLRTHD